MSLALFKLVATVITGTAGVGGSVGPFAYTEATRSSYQTHWNRTINSDGPVISCDESSFKYEFELTARGGQEGSGISIAVSKEEREQFATFGGGDSELIWTVEDDWGALDSQRVILKSNKGTNEVNCNKKIKWKRARAWSNSGTQRKWKIQQIKFVTTNCRDGVFTKTCDIAINSDSDLEWDSNYKPTITYSAF